MSFVQEDRCAYIGPGGQETVSARHSWTAWQEKSDRYGVLRERSCRRCGSIQVEYLLPAEPAREEVAREIPEAERLGRLWNAIQADPPEEVKAAMCRNMAELLANLDAAMDHGRAVKKQREQADKQNSVLGLFGAEAAAIPEPAWIEAEPITWEELCRLEKEAFGFYWHRSPQIARLEQALRDYEKAGSRRGRLVSIAEIKRRFTGREQP